MGAQVGVELLHGMLAALQRFAVPLIQIPLLPQEVTGLPRLIELGQQIYGNRRPSPAPVEEQVYA